MEKVRQGTAALVIPAFEFTNYEDGLNQTTFPRNKAVIFYITSDINLQYGSLYVTQGAPFSCS